jgi:ABC-type sugar transport system ATPase subunit
VPPLLKMEAPDKAFGGVIARCDARFDGDRGMVAAFCDGSAVRESTFLSIFVEISRLDAGESCRNDQRVECDGPAEALAASNVKFDQKLGVAPRVAGADRVFGREASDRFGGMDFRTVGPTLA